MEGIQQFFHSDTFKVIVFDLHGTLTNRTSIHPYHIDYRNKYIEERVGHKVPDNFNVSTDDAFEHFPQLDKYEFYKHRDNDPNFHFDFIHAPNPRLREQLLELKKHAKLILYTDSFLRQIEKTLEAIGIDNCFDRLIGNEVGQKKMKASDHFFNSLCTSYNADVSDLLIVGDRMDKDILPVLRAGGNALQVPDSKSINKALDILIKECFSNKREMEY